MNAPAFAARARAARAPDLAAPSAPSLERRRLQSYLGLMLGDIVAIFAGFAIAGYLYLGPAGAADSAVQAQLLLPIFLTIALYNGSYALDVLMRPYLGMIRGAFALLLSAASVVFIAFYTKSSAEFSRVAFTIGVLLAGAMLIWMRAQLRSFVAWRCGAHVMNELVIDDGGPPVDLPGTTKISAGALGLVPDIGDPHAMDRIGLALRNVDRVVVSCPPRRRGAWAIILKGANIAGEVLDDAVVELGAQGAREAGGHGWLLVSAGPLGMRARAIKRLFDIALAGSALLLLAPVMLAIAVAILIEDGRRCCFSSGGWAAAIAFSTSPSSAAWRQGRPIARVWFLPHATMGGSPGSARSSAAPASTNCRSCSMCFAAT